MKGEEFGRSRELEVLFRPRQNEASMLSANEVSTLLSRHQAETDYQMCLGRRNRRPVRRRAGIYSLAGATAMALATYLFFFTGTPPTTHQRRELASSSPLRRNEVRSFHTVPVRPIESRIAHEIPSRNNGLNQPTKANVLETSPKLPCFCLSAASYRVDAAATSTLGSSRVAALMNLPARPMSQSEQRVTYARSDHTGNDLLGSLYDIGYLTLADPVISAYDTVRSVSERTLATLNIVPHP